MKIIHLSDLHFEIAGTGGVSIPEGGLWSKTWRKVKIRELAAQLTNGEKNDCDVITFTGDLVSRADHSLLNESIDVITQIAEAIGVPKEGRFATVGNHDFGGSKRKAAKKTREKVLLELEKSGWNAVQSNRFWSTKSLSGEAVMLLLESREIVNGEKLPSLRTFVDSDFQELLESVRAEMQTCQTLVVASHDVPVLTMNDGHQYTPTVAERAWKHGGELLKIIIKNIEQCRSLLWMCGDAHSSNFHTPSIGSGKARISAAGPMNITSAMLVQAFPKKGKPVTAMTDPQRFWPSARAIILDSGSLEFRAHDFGYMPSDSGGFATYCSSGEWRSLAASASRAETQADRQEIAVTTSTSAARPARAKKKRRPRNKTKPRQCPDLFEVMSEPLQQEIEMCVRANALVDLEFSKTHSDEETLTWIPMSKLFVGQALLFRFVQQSAIWLRNQIDGESPSKISVIGVDSWGSMLAAQIGLMLGTGSTPIFSPFQEPWADRAEGIDSQKDAVKGSTRVIIITDVIATGKTISQIVSKLRQWAPGADFTVVAVLINNLLCDNSRSDLLPTKVRWGVGSARIPLLNTSLLNIQAKLGDYYRYGP